MLGPANSLALPAAVPEALASSALGFGIVVALAVRTVGMLGIILFVLFFPGPSLLDSDLETSQRHTLTLTDADV
jgi:hypothetical protein